MSSRNGKSANPYVLKREGKFTEALQTYADEFAEAHGEGNMYIAQMCFDQMVDVMLLEFLKENRRFDKTRDLEREVTVHLKKMVREPDMLDGRFQEYFEYSWDKFGRTKNGLPVMSVGKEQLIGPAPDPDDYLRL